MGRYVLDIPILRNCRSVHFTGIGGSGMSALAQLVNQQGFAVSGSDRGYDVQPGRPIYQRLARQGVEMRLQDGAAARIQPDCLVMTRAVEEDNPELVAARQEGIRVIKRPDLLASIVNANNSVAVSGSCGKSTTTAMIAQIAEEAGMNPTVILGASALRYRNELHIGNYRPGGSLVIAEVDESDGSVEEFRPNVAVLTNISKDHFEPAQLISFFIPFLDGAELAVLNADCHHSRFLVQRRRGNSVVYGQEGPLEFASFRAPGWKSEFSFDGRRYSLPIPGQHNISNALCAIAAARAMEIDSEVCDRALREYGGLQRRWNRYATGRGTEVVDDFAHSPAKIESALKTARHVRGRVFAIFQPHGFGPTRFMWDDYVRVFSRQLGSRDSLYLLPIYDAGGAANRSVNSQLLAGAINELRPSIACGLDRRSLVDSISKAARADDLVLVMGARDHSLAELAGEIANSLQDSALRS